MSKRVQTEADQKIAISLKEKQSFAVVAGAGSGKTSSLIDALKLIRKESGKDLRQGGQRIACITYTKRAVGVISSRLGYDDLFLVSTLHSFLWGEIKAFTKDIGDALFNHRIPSLIEKASANDNGSQSQRARKARDKISKLNEEKEKLHDVTAFKYDDATYSRYSEGRLSHDDVIEIAGYLLKNKTAFQRAFGFRYPFIFVDEAQDTFPIIVESLNAVTEALGLPVIGYFGDPWQQIYEKRAGGFQPPKGGKIITKTENFRCSVSVITFLNKFRQDVLQYAAGDNRERSGSVQIGLVQAEVPQSSRRYSDDQIESALQRMDQALDTWGWADRDDVIRLFLARQMIARRLGFVSLHSLFTGRYASQSAQEDYESGDHYLLKPILNAIWPTIKAFRNGTQRQVIDLLRNIGPAFDVRGKNKDRPLIEMVELSRKVIAELNQLWSNGSVKDIYEFCRDFDLVTLPERLVEHLTRDPRTEEFTEDTYGPEKGDWLCDEFFAMRTTELEAYSNFIKESTAYSTQHGVKGEEYSDVLVVFDDVEAGWNLYNFSKLLTPDTSGPPTDGQMRRSEKLAYVCFSRAEENLRILLYTQNPSAAKEELLRKGLFATSEIEIIS